MKTIFSYSWAIFNVLYDTNQIKRDVFFFLISFIIVKILVENL
jgi:hypothetical protein